MLKRYAFLPTIWILVLLLSVFVTSSWAVCPKDPIDRGECDTLNVFCLDCEIDTTLPEPYFVHFPLLVTHDQIDEIDSICGFAIPLAYTHTNPSAYCSVTSYWNNTYVYPFPDFFLANSIFRHLETSPGDTVFNRMMSLSEQWQTWDTFILNLGGPSRFWLAMIRQYQGRLWWEGDRTLLATMTFKVEDTMHVCIDTTFWPPTTPLAFARGDGPIYTPRHNMPKCFWVGAPDFTIGVIQARRKVLAGYSVGYDVLLTSLYGFASSCTLTVTGLPAGVSGSFNPNPIIPTDTSLMTVQTADTTTPGFYHLTVTATELGGAGIEHSAQAVLTVAVAETLWVVAHSPVDLIVTDPAGESISLDSNTIEDATYHNTVDVNGDLHDQVTIPQPLVGEYQIKVAREADATDADTFTLMVKASGNTEVFLAINAPVPPQGESADYSYVCLPYLRGDCTGDGVIDIGDIVYLINYVFRDGPAPDPIELGDVNFCKDLVEVVDLGDIVYLINYLFREKDPPCS